jgi:hypothetical protein
MMEHSFKGLDPDIVETMDHWLENRLLGVHTSLPGTLENYNADERRGDVKPAVNLPFPGGRYVEAPLIQGVPIVVPDSPGYRVDLELKNGATGIVIFSEAGIGNWLNGGAEPDADNGAKFNLTDAMFIPGAYPYGKVPPLKNGVKQRGGDVTHTASGDHTINAETIKLNGSSKSFVTYDELNTALQGLVTALNLEFGKKRDSTGTPGALLLDISASKTVTVKTGG